MERFTREDFAPFQKLLEHYGTIGANPNPHPFNVMQVTWLTDALMELFNDPQFRAKLMLTMQRDLLVAEPSREKLVTA